MFFTSIAARTDLGLIRVGNEDSALHHPKLIAVADGMGGAAGGEIASKIAIQTLAGAIDLLLATELDDESRIDLFGEILLRIENELAREINTNPELAGMGTTLTTLMPVANSIAMLHIGDSRAYRLRDGELSQLSHDHTVVQELIDQGKILPQEAVDHPQRSMLTQALMGKTLSGKDSQLDNFPIQLFPFEKGDIYLVASDGLTAVLSDEMIAKVISATPLDQAANNLITMVRDGGAPDNVTIVLASVGSEASDPDGLSLLGAAYE
jgi:serine/threonine protein phosphatase PrpC